MINGIRLKICGLTSLADAALADRCGADYLGFVLYPRSERHVGLAQYRAMAPRLPDRKKVAVTVEPSADEIADILAAGFDYVQIHCGHEATPAAVEGWAQAVGRARLWLAPRLPPEVELPAEFLPLADTFLFDAFHAGAFGGTGKTADWTKFRRHCEAHPEKTWILAGGLNPENIAVGLQVTGARFVDVNSGVEASPGIKDPAKLDALAARLAELRLD